MKRPKVLVLSRNYPNSVMPSLGLWVKHLVGELSENCDIKVIAPTPYAPPTKLFSDYIKYRQIEKRSVVDGVEIFHPRLIVGPGYSLYNVEGIMYFLSVYFLIKRIWKTFKFDIIHGNLIYADGFVATLLGKIYKKPVVITEHAMWDPWLDKHPLVGKQALWAAKNCDRIVAVSRALKICIMDFHNDEKKIKIIPCGVDGSLFVKNDIEKKSKPKRILYVGWVAYHKGVDVLLKSMKALKEKKVDVELIIIGQSYYKDQKRQENELKELAKQLGVSEMVYFAGGKSQKEIVEYLNQSSLLVLPSRRETFGAVLVEAMACGVPVVATKCGGPEDIITPDVGVLAEKEDEDSLAAAIKSALDNCDRYQGDKIRKYALENYSWESVGKRFEKLYGETLK